MWTKHKQVHQSCLVTHQWRYFIKYDHTHLCSNHSGPCSEVLTIIEWCMLYWTRQCKNVESTNRRNKGGLVRFIFRLGGIVHHLHSISSMNKGVYMHLNNHPFTVLYYNHTTTISGPIISHLQVLVHPDHCDEGLESWKVSFQPQKQPLEAMDSACESTRSKQEAGPRS